MKAWYREVFGSGDGDSFVEDETGAIEDWKMSTLGSKINREAG